MVSGKMKPGGPNRRGNLAQRRSGDSPRRVGVRGQGEREMKAVRGRLCRKHQVADGGQSFFFAAGGEGGTRVQSSPEKQKQKPVPRTNNSRWVGQQPARNRQSEVTLFVVVLGWDEGQGKAG